MESVLVKGKNYEIVGDNLTKMRENGLEKNYVGKRMLYGWTIHEACQAPKHYRLEDYRVEQKLKKLKCDTKAAKTRFREEKRKNERPWLYDGTPQLHPRCKYVADLMENDAFPKVVK